MDNHCFHRSAAVSCYWKYLSLLQAIYFDCTEVSSRLTDSSRERVKGRNGELNVLIHYYHTLQEFLEVSRWNDGSYWAIKESSETSHRKLLKFMNKYKVSC